MGPWFLVLDILRGYGPFLCWYILCVYFEHLEQIIKCFLWPIFCSVWNLLNLVANTLLQCMFHSFLRRRWFVFLATLFSCGIQYTMIPSLAFYMLLFNTRGRYSTHVSGFSHSIVQYFHSRSLFPSVRSIDFDDFKFLDSPAASCMRIA